MSIIAACKCGKRFSVKDEHAGKKIRCPACQQALLIPQAQADTIALDANVAEAPPPAPASRPAPAAEDGASVPRMPGVRVTAYPRSMRPTLGPGEKPSPRFQISLKAILLLSLLVLVPAAVYLVKAGPARAMAQWQELEPKLTSYTSDAVKRVLEKETEGIVFGKFMRPPKVTNVMLDDPIMMWKLPADIAVQGMTTEGLFKGVYHTGPRTLEIDVGLDGGRRKRHVKAHVTDPNGEVVADEIK